MDAYGIDMTSSGNINIDANSNSKHVYINGSRPIYGLTLVILTSYPSGYDAVDYFTSDGTTWYVGINYSDWRC